MNRTSFVLCRHVALVMIWIAAVLAVNDAAPPLIVGARAQPVAGQMPAIGELWRAQPDRIAAELSGLRPRIAGRTNIYAIAVAAQGSQQLFSREATLALRTTADRFGTSYRGGMLLSNGLIDLTDHPLATPDTLAKAASGIAARIDPAQDLVVIYLVSHGSPEAWIATDLPDKVRFPPISAKALASALSDAGIRRRIVIISACFAASWIPALASDDTIVIAAAAKDRTSFGCDDRRRLTWFGEAFLEGGFGRSASLRGAFEAARATVTEWETTGGFVPSRPEASIGRNLQRLWSEKQPILRR